MHPALPILRKSPIDHAWAIQDLTLWPDRSQLFWKEGRGGISYVHLSGHPSQTRHRLAVLSDEGGVLEPLLEHLPDTPLVVRETPAAVRPLLERRLPGALFYEEQKMRVDRASFRARTAESVRRITLDDAPALAAFTGAPPQAAGGMRQWIQSAVILARLEGERIASLVTTIVRTPEVWHLAGIETKPEFRGRGYAAAVTSAITELGLAEVPSVTLTVLKSNAPALGLYEGLGFRHYADEIWMDFGTGARP